MQAENKEQGTVESSGDAHNKSVMSSSATPGPKCKSHKKAMELSGQVVSVLIDRLVALHPAMNAPSAAAK
jgi:hypothetical protein